MKNNNTQHYIGCITGTSVDGLDVALVKIDDAEHIEVQRAETRPLPEALRQQLLQLGQPGSDDLDLLGDCDTALGIFIGETILSLLKAWEIAPGAVTAVGSHGQTVRHRPPDAYRTHGFSTQIGDPNHIAEITGIQTVADFRRRDMAAGGHGAPLVPPFHQALFGHLPGKTVVLNVGGISNISILGETPSGFDTGPGNALMDGWCTLHTGASYDANGNWSASGHIDETLLAEFLSDPYFALAPPKSTGREYFNQPWLSNYLQTSNAAPADVQATLCELTARCTQQAIKQWAPDTNTLIVCGGGRLNANLMTRLQTGANFPVAASEQWSIDGDSIEAALFGWLAYRRLQGQSGNEPAVSGALGYRVLGALYPA